MANETAEGDKLDKHHKFNKLITAVEGVARRHALAVGGSIDDCVQEALLKAWECIDKSYSYIWIAVRGRLKRFTFEDNTLRCTNRRLVRQPLGNCAVSMEDEVDNQLIKLLLARYTQKEICEILGTTTYEFRRRLNAVRKAYQPQLDAARNFERRRNHKKASQQDEARICRSA